MSEARGESGKKARRPPDGSAARLCSPDTNRGRLQARTPALCSPRWRTPRCRGQRRPAAGALLHACGGCQPARLRPPCASTPGYAASLSPLRRAAANTVGGPRWAAYKVCLTELAPCPPQGLAAARRPPLPTQASCTGPGAKPEVRRGWRTAFFVCGRLGHASLSQTLLVLCLFAGLRGPLRRRAASARRSCRGWGTRVRRFAVVVSRALCWASSRPPFDPAALALRPLAAGASARRGAAVAPPAQRGRRCCGGQGGLRGVVATAAPPGPRCPPPRSFFLIPARPTALRRPRGPRRG